MSLIEHNEFASTRSSICINRLLDNIISAIDDMSRANEMWCTCHMHARFCHLCNWVSRENQILFFSIDIGFLSQSHACNSVCQVMIRIAIDWQLIGGQFRNHRMWKKKINYAYIKSINKFILQKKTHAHTHIHFYVRYSCLLSANLAK